LPATLVTVAIALFVAIAAHSPAILVAIAIALLPLPSLLTATLTLPFTLLLLALPLPSSLPPSLIYVAIANVAAVAVTIANSLVAVAHLPPLLPLPSLLLPLPSLLHTTLVTNAMALADLALFVARHPHSPSPLLPSPF
jgi:hypothetical protein